MGWMYMLVCTADFVVFPVLWSLVQALHGGQVTNQWNPITLQGAGLFHMAMGAVLGVAAFGRTQEKMAGANNGGLSTQTGISAAPSLPAPVQAPMPIPAASSRPPMPTAPSSSGFGGLSSPAAAQGVTTSSSGKPMPVQPQQEEL